MKKISWSEKLAAYMMVGLATLMALAVLFIITAMIVIIAYAIVLAIIENYKSMIIPSAIICGILILAAIIGYVMIKTGIVDKIL